VVTMGFDFRKGKPVRLGKVRRQDTQHAAIWNNQRLTSWMLPICAPLETRAPSKDSSNTPIPAIVQLPPFVWPGSLSRQAPATCGLDHVVAIGLGHREIEQDQVRLYLPGALRRPSQRTP